MRTPNKVAVRERGRQMPVARERAASNDRFRRTAAESLPGYGN